MGDSSRSATPIPTPTWVPLVSKLIALILVPVVLQIVLML